MTQHPDPEEFDLFVSYAEADKAWVNGYLLAALTEAGVQWHSESTFDLGVPRLLEFQRAVQQSRRTLLILTPAYLTESFSNFTDVFAQSYGVETGAWPVIPLILQPVKLEPRLAMLTSLDATDPDTWPEVLSRLLMNLQRPLPPPPEKPPCPYPGMRAFVEADSPCFFGRDRKTDELLQALRLHPFVAVIGPSGSGKSSLVFAGLVPLLKRSRLFGDGDWLVRTMRPGPEPLAALATALGGNPTDPSQAVAELLAGPPKAQWLLLVVDQFEELFTQAKSEVDPFGQALLQLAEIPACYVVPTVRADFYPELMQSQLLWPEIEAYHINVPPLDAAGLREAIVRPAEATAVFLEQRLVEQLVGDAIGQPGCLPFLQEALRQLWDRLTFRFLPYSAYVALGDANRTGLQVAMARHADNALKELGEKQKIMARRIFLRLVEFGTGRADIRRQQPVSALRSADEDKHEFDRTLAHLARHRLITLTGEEQGEKQGEDKKADIAHEALISGWPSLASWVQERREADLTRRRLESKAEEWVRLGRSTGGLLDKEELSEVKRWMAGADAAELGYSVELKKLVGASRTALRTQRVRLGFTASIASILLLAVLAWLGIRGYQEWNREWVRSHTGTELVPIGGGPAAIGTVDPADSPNVTLLPFRIERYEVSFAQYQACHDFGPCDCLPHSIFEKIYEDNDIAWDDYPIVEITARQAHVYCTWLGRRLPTMVEWERAARGKEGRLWPWGNDSLPTKYLFGVSQGFVPDLDDERLETTLKTEFQVNGVDLHQDASVRVEMQGSSWTIDSGEAQYSVRKEKDTEGDEYRLSVYEDHELPDEVMPVNSEPETATLPPEEGIFHLAYNVSEWAVQVPTDCEDESCHQAWDEEADVFIMGRTHKRSNDIVPHVAARQIAGPDTPVEQTGFRCAADSLP